MDPQDLTDKVNCLLELAIQQCQPNHDLYCNIRWYSPGPLKRIDVTWGWLKDNSNPPIEYHLVQCKQHFRPKYDILSCKLCLQYKVMKVVMATAAPAAPAAVATTPL